MKHLLLVTVLSLLVLSCKKKENVGYSSYIGIANKTSYNLEVKLYPKSAYCYSSELYKLGSGYYERNFKKHPDDSIWWARTDFYFTEDTTVRASTLLDAVFDSIIISVKNSDSTVIKLSKNSCTNYRINPFLTDTIWSRNKMLRSMINQSWKGFEYHYVLFIEKKFLGKSPSLLK
jgi:hypothetical protein